MGFNFILCSNYYIQVGGSVMQHTCRLLYVAKNTSSFLDVENSLKEAYQFGQSHTSSKGRFESWIQLIMTLESLVERSVIL